MKVSESYSGGKGESYTRTRQADPLSQGYAIDFEYFRPYLRQDDVVLDFGCGNGGILRILVECVARADGLEVNPAAAAKGEKLGLRIIPSISELPHDPTYDVILSNHVLEHLRDVCDTLESLKESLKPGGLLLLKVPFDDATARYQQTWSPEDDPDHHLQTWTPRLLANTLFESGYKVERCELVTSAWHPKLFPFRNLGLGPLVFWLLGVIRKRRQIFAVARKP